MRAHTPEIDDNSAAMNGADTLGQGGGGGSEQRFTSEQNRTAHRQCTNLRGQFEASPRITLSPFLELVGGLMSPKIIYIYVRRAAAPMAPCVWEASTIFGTLSSLTLAPRNAAPPRPSGRQGPRPLLLTHGK